MAIFSGGILTEIKWISTALAKMGKAGQFLMELINTVRKGMGKVERIIKKVTRQFISNGSGTDLIRTTILKNGKKVQIKSGHGYNRAHATGDLRNTGLSMDDIENEILDDIEKQLSKKIAIPQSGTPGFGGPVEFTININNNRIGYRVIQLPDGSYSIGTYFLK